MSIFTLPLPRMFSQPLIALLLAVIPASIPLFVIVPAGQAQTGRHRVLPAQRGADQLRVRWNRAVRDIRRAHTTMTLREQAASDPGRLELLMAQRQKLVTRLSKMSVKCARTLGRREPVCHKIRKLLKRLRAYIRRHPIEKGWTAFSPTPLDIQAAAPSDPKQPGTRLVYVSKTSSPAALWDETAAYKSGDVVVYPVAKEEVNGPSVRDAFWRADGTQSTGTAPGPTSPGWTAVPDPGVVYFWDGTRVVDGNGNSYGNDPFNPQGITSFYSYGTSKAEISAWGNLRGGYSDWCLFRRGETWTAGIDQFTGFRSIEGQSPAAPSLHGAFGPLTGDRPAFKWQNTPLFTDWFGNRYETFISIWFNRNPIRGNMSFVSLAFSPKDPAASDRGSGVSIVGAWKEPVLLDNILFEDLKIDGTGYGFLFQWLATQQDQPGSLEFNIGVTIRRSIVTNIWNADSHNQGMYVSRVKRVLVDESVFDRNGYKGDPRLDDTKRDIFSRNFYLSSCDQMGITLRNTISSNGGSGGPQMRCGGTLERSLILNEGYAFTAAQGNSMDWTERRQGGSFLIRDNVMFKWQATGTTDNRSHPAWGLAVQSGAFGGEVYRNIFSGQHMSLNGTGEADNHAIMLLGSDAGTSLTSGNLVHDNISYRAGSLEVRAAETLTGSGFSSNAVLSQFRCARVSALTDTIFSKNRCYTNFSSPYRSGSSDLSYPQFVASHIAADDGASTVSPLDGAASAEGWPAPDRSVRSYLESLGYSVQSADGARDLMQRCTGQRKGNWHDEFTAAAVVNYVRAGFGLPPAR